MRRLSWLPCLVLCVLPWPAWAGTLEIRTPRVHATDCTALTNGREGELCWEKGSNRLFVCEPTEGACDTPEEWILPAGTVTSLAAPLEFTGAPPTIVACGTSPSVVGTMLSGTITVGSGTVTICELTFPEAWTNKPACVVANETQAMAFRVVTSTTALTMIGADFAGDTVHYLCGGWQ